MSHIENFKTSNICFISKKYIQKQRDCLENDSIVYLLFFHDKEAEMKLKISGKTPQLSNDYLREEGHEQCQIV